MLVYLIFLILVNFYHFLLWFKKFTTLVSPVSFFIFGFPLILYGKLKELSGCAYETYSTEDLIALEIWDSVGLPKILSLGYFLTCGLTWLSNKFKSR